MICKECECVKAETRSGGKTCLGKPVPPKKIFFCKHPNQNHIEDFMIKHHIYYKETGEICFANSKGEMKIKTAPRWCPLKAGK